MQSPTISSSPASASPSAASASPSPAKKKPNAEDFEMGGILGEGSYAKVLLCKRKTTGQNFAVKMVDKNFVRRYQKEEEMLNEKRVLSMLDHPNIIKLHYTFQDEFSLYYVLELAGFGELFQLIQKMGKLPALMAQFFAAELVNALEYLHSRGIIHRDLKPENVLIAVDGHVKLTDFATSKVVQADAVNGPRRKKSFVGTAEYVSPELLNNQPITSSADAWALGCVIFQMLSGKPPFRGESEYLTFQKILNRELVFPSFFSPESCDLINGLLTVDSSKRLGATLDSYAQLKAYPFFHGIDFAAVSTAPVPEFILAELKSMAFVERPKFKALSLDEDSDEEDMRPSGSNSRVNAARAEDAKEEEEPVDMQLPKQNMDVWRKYLLDKEDIVFMGLVSKRRSIFAKKRQLILTSFPRFIYINPETMELRGEIVWSDKLYVEQKSDRIFHIHTPKRYYHMQALDCNARAWVEAINRQIERERKTHAASSKS